MKQLQDLFQTHHLTFTPIPGRQPRGGALGIHGDEGTIINKRVLEYKGQAHRHTLPALNYHGSLETKGAWQPQ